MRDSLLASELGLDVTWHPFPPGAPAITGLRALMPSRERESFLGQNRSSADTPTFKLSRTALPQPTRDDEFDVLFPRPEGVEVRRYRVIDARPPDDDRGLWWLVRGEPRDCPC